MNLVLLLLAIFGVLALPHDATAQFTRSGNYWVPNQMISNLPPDVRNFYYPSTRPRITPSPGPANQDTIDRCQVIRVTDGDTITVLANGFHCEVRLRDIDAPEANQKFGAEATRALETMLGREAVKVAWRERDKYGRFVGTVYLDGQDINLKMIQLGLAWNYVPQSTNALYASEELDARNRRVGLWLGADPMAPWLFRAVAR